MAKAARRRYIMLKSEAEHMLRRALEETGAELTDEQVEALALAVLNIVNRIVEEALASYRPGVPGGRPNFFSG